MQEKQESSKCYYYDALRAHEPGKLAHFLLGCHLALYSHLILKCVALKDLPQRGAGAMKRVHSGQHIVVRKLVSSPPLDHALDGLLSAGSELRVSFIECNMMQ